MTSSSNVNSAENWQRGNLIGELCIKGAYLDVLHNRIGDPSYIGLPEDGVLLYRRMVTFKANKQRELQNVFRREQWDLICPKSGRSNSNDWDITIIRVVIQYECGLLPPIAGWKGKLHSIMDITIAANVCLAKDIRNELKHGTIKDMNDSAKYNNLIIRIEQVLLGMKYVKMELFYNLKSCSIKVYTPDIVKIIEGRLSDFEDTHKEMKTTITDIQTQQTAELKELRKLLLHQDARMNLHGDILDAYGDRLDAYGDRLYEHGDRLDEYDDRMKQHDIQLAAIRRSEEVKEGM